MDSEPIRTEALMRVSDILRVKGNALCTASPDSSLRSAVEMMATNDIGSVVIMERGALVGMLTFREVIKTLHANHGVLGDGSVRAVMDAQPFTVTPHTDVNEVRRVMLERHTRYLPVLDGATLAGVISFYDVARAVLEEQGYENEQLKAYIQDWRPATEGV
jgi:CBS domain-containing protein